MWPKQGIAVETEWIQGCLGCIIPVLYGLKVESVEDIWYLFLVMAAGSSTDVYYTVSSFQGDCVFSWVGGKQVYECASSARYIASSLQEILLFAAISDLKDGNGKNGNLLLDLLPVVCWGSADLRTSNAFVLVFSPPGCTRSAKESGKDLAPVLFVVFFSGNWNALVEKCARAASTKLFWVFA